MIDYGDDFDTNNGVTRWRVRQFRPALFVKTIVDKIFNYAGFSYNSDFFNSTRFQKLIIPFSGEKLFANDSQIADRNFQASQSGVDGAYISTDFTDINNNVEFRTVRLNDDSTGTNFDGGNNWNTSTWVYDVPNDGYYSFNIKQELQLERTIINSNRIYGGSLNAKLQIIRTDTSLNTTVIAEATQPFTLTGNPATYDTTLSLSSSVNDYLMFDGDKVQFRLILDWIDFAAVNLSGQAISRDNLFSDFDLTSNSATGLCNASSEIFEGDPLTILQTVPDITMVDFMMSIIKMFNLYVTVDPLNETSLTIETRDEYYSSGITRDWTKKLARDRKTELKPLGLLSARVYNYKYKEDSDYYNERYQTARLEPYGTRRYEVDNDFLNNEKDVEVVFSPTPMQIEGNSARFVARIYDNDISEGAKPTETNVRIS